METTKPTCEKVLEKVQCQFLRCFPLRYVNWKELENLVWHEQKKLIDCTVEHKLNQQLPVRLDYQTQFLKQLIQRLEINGVEIHDQVYERFCQLQQILSENMPKFTYKHYILPKQQVHFTLRESTCFVSDGTTGLCTWQASFALANYLLCYPHLVQEKHVIELGAGTGLCGFVLLRCCAVKRMLLTDGSDLCIQVMHSNLLRNFPNADVHGPGTYDIGVQKLELLHMPWSCIDSYKSTIVTFDTDVLLAADVVYDESMFDDLLNAIDSIFLYATKPLIMLLSVTVRNPETVQKFLLLLHKHNFTAKELEDIHPEKGCLEWDYSSPVTLYKIRKCVC